MIKKDAWHGRSSARLLYYSYKDRPYFSFLIIAIIISVVIILAFNVIIPQTENLFSISNESEETRRRIEILKKNFSDISRINKDTLEKDRQTLIKALPVDKRFSDVIYAVAFSAMKSGVNIDDFSFSVGPLSSGSVIAKKDADNIDNVRLKLFIESDIDGAKRFMEEISQSLPIGEIVSAEGTEGGVLITLEFYNKPYRAPRVVDIEPIRQISAENMSLLSTLKSRSERMNVPVNDTAVRDVNLSLF